LIAGAQPAFTLLFSTNASSIDASVLHQKEKSMDPVAAKYLGAGLAAIGTGAAAIGVGTLFGHFLNGALRNPSAVEGQFGRLIFGFAVTEALGIFALLISFLLLFAV
jgi:F-type H+-transporting ATPase subunit c